MREMRVDGRTHKEQREAMRADIATKEASQKALTAEIADLDKQIGTLQVKRLKKETEYNAAEEELIKLVCRSHAIAQGEQHAMLSEQRKAAAVPGENAADGEQQLEDYAAQDEATND